MRWTLRSSSTTSTWTGSVAGTWTSFLPRSLLEDTDVGRSHGGRDHPVLRQERTARVRPAIPEAPRQQEQGSTAGREVLQGTPVDEPLPVLHAPEEQVTLAQLGGVLTPQLAGGGESGQRVERTVLSDATEPPPVHQFQILGGELHVDQAALTGLRIQLLHRFAGHLALHPHPEPVDLLGRTVRKRALPDEGRERGSEEPLPVRDITRNRPGLHQRLPFPELRPSGVVLEEGLLAHHQRPVVPGRRGRRGDLVQPPRAVLEGQERQGSLPHPREVFGVAQPPRRSAGGLLVGPRPVDEEEVQVRVVAELAPAELSHPEDRQRRPAPVPHPRDAPPSTRVLRGEEHGVVEQAVRQRGELPRHLGHLELTGDVAAADPERLLALEAPPRPEQLLRILRGPRGPSVQLGADPLGWLVERLRIPGDELIQELGGPRQLGAEVRALAEEVEQPPCHRRALVEEAQVARRH